MASDGAGRPGSDFRSAYVAKCKEFEIEPLPEVLDRVTAAEHSGSNKIDSLELLGNSKELFSRRLTDHHVEALVEGILTGTVIVGGLFLCHNRVGDAGAVALARLFSEESAGYTCTLRALNLQGNMVGVDGCRALARAVQASGNRTLGYLNFNGNPIGKDGGMAVAELLAANDSLHTLDLGNCELETGALVALCTVLQTNNTLQELSLANPRLFSRTEDTTYHIARMLRCNSGLVRLSLAKNRIGDFGAQLLSEYLADNSTLLSLDVSCNSIAAVGGEALAALLLRGSPLETVNLSANRIGDDGAEAFGVALRRCATLRSLDLRNNSIGDRGLTALATAFDNNVTLAQLLVWGNHFDTASRDAFAGVVDSKAPSTGLQLDLKPFVVDGAVQVAEQDVESVM